MVRQSTLLIATLLAGLADAPDRRAHAAMLIDHIPADMWRGQREARPTDDPEEQKALRADVALYVKGRFRVVGERLFVIPPDEGIRLREGPSYSGALLSSKRSIARPLTSNGHSSATYGTHCTPTNLWKP